MLRSLRLRNIEICWLKKKKDWCVEILRLRLMLKYWDLDKDFEMLHKVNLNTLYWNRMTNICTNYVYVDMIVYVLGMPSLSR